MQNKVIIPKGSILYRFVDCSPSACKLGMTRNKGEKGRCNRDNNIYYCCKSLNGVLEEMMFHSISGTLIISDVIEDIECGIITLPELHKIFRGRTKNDKKQYFHTELMEKIGYDFETSEKDTNDIATSLIKIHPDGIVYSSVNSIDTIIGDTIFQLDEDTGFSNIALTEQGFNKTRQRTPICYWWYANKELKNENNRDEN